ncbi:40S ribosomal protein S27 [Hibiscus syriacus]|uniref:40S ribosomal protein S27 n=1 Tax=Hibiscus syriacus TaxID=106335 RepID=A0A6A2ZG65_HIBSY|nr:40S ribosomal protein S27 [Hibiscus syriacus]
MVLQNDIDLLNPPVEIEKKKHKLKRLVQSPNSFFMTVLCQPTGGKARLTEGCSFRKKGD